MRRTEFSLKTRSCAEENPQQKLLENKAAYNHLNFSAFSALLLMLIIHHETVQKC